MKRLHARSCSLAMAAVLTALPAPMLAAAGLARPNWDRQLAAEYAAAAPSRPELQAWFAALRAGTAGELIAELRAFSRRGDIPLPVRESLLHEFALGLDDFPASAVPADLLDFLAAYRPRVLVAHEESAALGVPMFNVPAAAAGVRHGQQRSAGEASSAQLLAADPQLWLRAYLAASPAARRGFLDRLGVAPRDDIRRLARAASPLLAGSPELTAVCGLAALELSDPGLLIEVVLRGSGPDLAPLLRQAALRLPPPELLPVLLAAVEAAPAVNASLAIAALEPALRGEAATSEILLTLLDDAELGSAAALALSHDTGAETRARLEHLAAAGRDGSARARLALRLAAERERSEARR